MSDERIVCTLKYLVKGVIPDREDRQELRQELLEVLRHALDVTILPVVEGYSVEIEMVDLEPFNRFNFEPYVAEQILPEVVASRCQATGPVQMQLLKSQFR